MVQPAAPASCLSCITTPIVNSYPCQLISGIAQKIADFVTGIFTTIANFVRYCLCMSTPAAAPVPVNPAPAAAAAPTITPPAPAPAPRAATSTSSAPAAATSAPAINPAVVEAGKRFLLSRVAVIDQANPNNTFRARLDTEKNGRRAFATVLVHASLIVNAAQEQLLTAFMNSCNSGHGFHPMQDLANLKASYEQLDEPSRRAAIQRLTTFQSSRQQPTAAVAAFLYEANINRERLAQDPVFSEAAEAARMELAPEVL